MARGATAPTTDPRRETPARARSKKKTVAKQAPVSRKPPPENDASEELARVPDAVEEKPGEMDPAPEVTETETVEATVIEAPDEVTPTAEAEIELKNAPDEAAADDTTEPAAKTAPVEVPTVDEPAVDEPAVDEPTVDQPVTEAPQIEAPAAPDEGDVDSTEGLLRRDVQPARPLRPLQMRTRPRVRRVTRTVRHIDTWSVFKIAVVFHIFLYIVCLTAGVLLWRVADTTGTLDNVENFFLDFGWETFELKGGEVYHQAWIGGLFIAAGLTGLWVLMATLFNLITDLVGGVRVTVLEEEVVARGERPMTRRALQSYRRAQRREQSQHQQTVIPAAPHPDPAPDEAATEPTAEPTVETAVVDAEPVPAEQR